MKLPQAQTAGKPRQSDYWMRAVSFAGLHRMLSAIARHPGGLRAKEINELVIEKRVILTPRHIGPKPTTLYHYRNTLLRLDALRRNGLKLIANKGNPHVQNLLHLPAPADQEQSLSDSARECFASLVLDNAECRSLFFDLFMPSSTRATTISDFRKHGMPIEWERPDSPHTTKVVLRNRATARTTYCRSHASVAAVLYGVRYWARDELQLVDEYRQIAGGTIMFPLTRRTASAAEHDRAIAETICFLLSLRGSDEWAFFSVLELIERCCAERRQPISLLFDALDSLLQRWRHDIVLIPTSRGVATLTAKSAQEQNLVLRRYYTHGNGPYISHIRIHKSVTDEPWKATNDDAQRPSETRARF